MVWFQATEFWMVYYAAVANSHVQQYNKKYILCRIWLFSRKALQDIYSSVLSLPLLLHFLLRMSLKISISQSFCFQPPSHYSFSLVSFILSHGLSSYRWLPNLPLCELYWAESEFKWSTEQVYIIFSQKNHDSICSNVKSYSHSFIVSYTSSSSSLISLSLDSVTTILTSPRPKSSSPKTLHMPNHSTMSHICPFPLSS